MNAPIQALTEYPTRGGEVARVDFWSERQFAWIGKIGGRDSAWGRDGRRLADVDSDDDLMVGEK